VNSDPKIHWYGILNSVILVGILSIIVGVIVLRTINRDIEFYNNDMDKVNLHAIALSQSLGRTRRSEWMEISTRRCLPASIEKSHFCSTGKILAIQY